MPEVAIRQVTASDLPELLKFDLSYSSSWVWQMERMTQEGTMGASFREVRLPREVRVMYPRAAAQIFTDLSDPQMMYLIATVTGQCAGYISISARMSPQTAWVKDLAVQEGFRAKGIGAALLGAALEWSMGQRDRRIVMEMQSKNYPAIQLARKGGFDFAGFQAQYYSNQDMALFFARSLR